MMGGTWDRRWRRGGVVSRVRVDRQDFCLPPVLCCCGSYRVAWGLAGAVV